MAAAARYWRVVANYQRIPVSVTLCVEGMRWFDALDTDLSKDLVAGKIVVAGANDWRTEGATTNLVDGTNTSVEITPSPSGVGCYVAFYTFDFTTPVLPEYVELQIGTVVAGHWTPRVPVPLNCLDIWMYSSSNGTNWDLMIQHSTPVAAYNTKTKIGIEYSSKYPVPVSNALTGTGGIYGIVSEDGVAMPNRGVHLFDRDTMYRFGYATTDEYGGYGFNGLNQDKEYMLLSVDPSGPPYKNAIVWDRIKPINTLSATATQTNGFWSKRLRDPAFGGSVSFLGFAEGAYKNYRASLGSYGHDNDYDSTTMGHSLAPVTSDVGGGFSFLKSGRYEVTPINRGAMFILGGCGTPTGINAGSTPQNYSNLTFEHICYSPATGESPMYLTWCGTKDTDDVSLGGYDHNWGHYAPGTGPQIGLTTDTLSLRCPLGTRNLSILRGSTPILPNTKYHILVTFELDVALKVYLNGVLVITCLIPATGRIMGWQRSRDRWQGYDMSEWDRMDVGHMSGLIRRFTAFQVTGSGLTPDVSTTNAQAGPGWGGFFGFAAMYHRTMTDADAAAQYDSYLNWDTYVAPVTQVGYAAEVEADTPLLYFPMTETVSGVVQSVLGIRSWRALYVGSPVYGKTGFVSGLPAVELNSTDDRLAIMSTSKIMPNTFTVIFWWRPTVAVPSSTQTLFLERVQDSVHTLYLSRNTSGKLYLGLYDQGRTGDQIYTFTNNNLVADQDYCIAISYDAWVSKKVRLYLNGVLVSELPAAQLLTTVSTHLVHAHCLSIGGNNTGGSRNGGVPNWVDSIAPGVYGHFALYGYELSAARIAAQYAARNA